MDEMRISSKFTTSLIGKILKGILKKKLGYEIDITLNEITAYVKDGVAHVHVNGDAEMDREALNTLVHNLNS